MQFMSLMADIATKFALLTAGGGDDATTNNDFDWGDWEFLKEIVEAIDWVMIPIMILVGTAGLIYAVVLGVNLARADSAEKIKEAKSRMINAIIGLVSIIALCLLLWLFIENVPTIFGFTQEGTASALIGI